MGLLLGEMGFCQVSSFLLCLDLEPQRVRAGSVLPCCCFVEMKSLESHVHASSEAQLPGCSLSVNQRPSSDLSPVRPGKWSALCPCYPALQSGPK